MNLDNQIALVTGATRGIGQAIALDLAKAGATVFGTATSDTGAEKISTYFESAGLSGRGLRLNVTDQDAVSATLDHIKKEAGAVSILINNAGITRDNLVLRMKDDEWNEVINTNLTAVYYLTKRCIKNMFRARYGRIVNISSVVGATGNAGQANYAAAKAGLIGFTKSIAQEIASRGITANVVAPGFIDTDMTRNLMDVQKEGILKAIPMKKMGEPSDIAQAVHFLVSDLSKYITGQTIHVNGGMFMA